MKDKEVVLTNIGEIAYRSKLKDLKQMVNATITKYIKEFIS